MNAEQLPDQANSTMAVPPAKLDAVYSALSTQHSAPRRGELLAPAGCQLAAVARQCAKRGLAGLVWASNVPGTVGAAVVNNAGAFGGAMAEVLERALVVDAAGETAYLTPEDLAMAYRSTRLK